MNRKSSLSASGRFVLRINPSVHAVLREAANHAGLSLNDYCARKLTLPAGEVVGPASAVVSRAASLIGGELVGVLVFGSWARSELNEESDIDVMVVVSREAALTRELYRRWDSTPLTWEGRRVEPHFVRFPEMGARVSGLWAEVAVDGVVLFDRNLSVSRLLVDIRRRIVAGEILRREVNGQPYWVGAA